ncbi:hypothetical protein EYF80_047864 [Liparis tanakae]|uniref:Uncharacterized protein n=1 Tax=Liparis tanakae TaxID=230148 RepID=A0A4Z2FM67_9TELE|nr:hypothetical protein EYF80_047864 [Liparis tanakae]
MIGLAGSPTGCRVHRHHKNTHRREKRHSVGFDNGGEDNGQCNEALQQEVQLLHQELEEVKLWRSEGRNTGALRSFGNSQGWSVPGCQRTAGDRRLFQLQNTETSQSIRGSNNDLEVLMDVKKNYKALKPEKTVLMRQSPHPKKRVTPTERRDAQMKHSLLANSGTFIDMFSSMCTVVS